MIQNAPIPPALWLLLLFVPVRSSLSLFVPVRSHSFDHVHIPSGSTRIGTPKLPHSYQALILDTADAEVARQGARNTETFASQLQTPRRTE